MDDPEVGSGGDTSRASNARRVDSSSTVMPSPDVVRTATNTRPPAAARTRATPASRRLVSWTSTTSAFRRASLAVLVGALVVADTHPQSPTVIAQTTAYHRVDLTLVTTLGGAVTGVVVDGATGIAYVSRGARVEALDVTSDPTTPKVLATSERLAGVDIVGS